MLVFRGGGGKQKQKQFSAAKSARKKNVIWRFMVDLFWGGEENWAQQQIEQFNLCYAGWAHSIDIRKL